MQIVLVFKLDLHVCFLGNPLADLTRFVTFCTDGNVRREHESKLIEAYYNRLCENYEKHGAKPPFSLQQVSGANETRKEVARNDFTNSMKLN